VKQSCVCVAVDHNKWFVTSPNTHVSASTKKWRILMAEYDNNVHILDCTTDEFFYDKEICTFTAEASMLNLKPGEVPLVVVVTNPKTKHKAHFRRTNMTFDGIYFSPRYWGEDEIFRYCAMVHRKPIFLNIFND